MSFPAQHKGHVEKRDWYKVRWIKQPPGEKKSLVGRTDLLIENQYREYRNFVEVLEKVSMPLCAAGLSSGFGNVNDAEIDKWIAGNSK